MVQNTPASTKHLSAVPNPAPAPDEPEISPDLYARTVSISRETLNGSRNNYYATKIIALTPPLEKVLYYALNCAPGTSSALVSGILLASLPHYGTAAFSPGATGLFVLAVGALYDLYNWREFLRKK